MQEALGSIPSASIFVSVFHSRTLTPIRFWRMEGINDVPFPSHSPPLPSPSLSPFLSPSSSPPFSFPSAALLPHPLAVLPIPPSPSPLSASLLLPLPCLHPHPPHPLSLPPSQLRGMSGRSFATCVLAGRAGCFEEEGGRNGKERGEKGKGRRLFPASFRPSSSFPPPSALIAGTHWLLPLYIYILEQKAALCWMA